MRREVPITTESIPLDSDRANLVSRIFKNLRMPDLDGTPRVQDLMNTCHWVDTVGRALFGNDQIREALVLTPKKQSKTSSGSLMFFAASLANTLPNQSYTILAPTLGIADFAFNQVRGSINADEGLSQRFKIRRNTREIENLVNGSIVSVKPASPDAITGLKGNVFVDELHIWGKMREGQRLRQQLRGALAASASARALYITTQSDEEPRGLYSNMLQYARMVRDGDIVDPSFLPVLYEPWPGLDPINHPEYWQCLMPSFPHIVGPEFYRSVISEAQMSGKAAMAQMKSQYFNVQIGLDDMPSDWAVSRKQAACRSDISLQDIIATCTSIAVGIDLGGSDDMTSIVVLGELDGEWYVWCRSYLSQSAVEANTVNWARLKAFEEDGDLVLVEPGEDIPVLVNICLDVYETGNLVGVGIDPAGAADLADALEETGVFVLEENLHGVGQSAFKLAPAVRTIERRVDRDAVTFAEQEIMTWSLGNVVMTKAGNAPSITKAAALDKIDPVMALLDAVTIMIHHRADKFDVESLIG